MHQNCYIYDQQEQNILAQDNLIVEAVSKFKPFE